MEYHWIDTKTLLGLDSLNIALFGAGRGAEETLHFIQDRGLKLNVCGIVDNNRSLHGKQLFGHLVYSPHALTVSRQDVILVTSVSGKDSISVQLENLGFRSGRDFICIGRYPSGYAYNIRQLVSVQDLGELDGKRCLHVGPGGFLGLEMCLYAFGAAEVYSVDKFSFGYQEQGMTTRKSEYQAVRVCLQEVSFSEAKARERQARFDSLLVENKNSSMIDPSKILYSYPVDVESMPFEDGFFDCVYSFALLEHVENPETAVRELARVTRPGGKNLHTIVTGDHRSFSAFKEFHPFSFRLVCDEEWRKTVKDAFYQNRLMPVQWRALFQKEGFRIVYSGVDEHLDVDLYDYELFHADFAGYNKEELGEVGCKLFLIKQ